MTTLTWLHLSDLHLHGTESSVDHQAFRDMLEDIEMLRKEEDLYPDAIFFTGDTAFSGRPEQFKLAMEFFDKVLKTCGLSGRRDRFFVVPGNHDVNRIAVEEPPWVYEQYVDFAKALLGSDEYHYHEINRFLGDNAHKKWAFEKFGNFAQFIDEFFADEEMKFDCDRYYSVRHIEKEGRKVVVIGLNSAWLSFRDDEQGRLLVGEQQVCDALDEAEKKWPDAHWRIALMHHPLYWLAEKDIHRVQQRLPKKCHLLLRGHLHYPSFSIQSTPDSHLLEFAAGASLQAQ